MRIILAGGLRGYAQWFVRQRASANNLISAFILPLRNLAWAFVHIRNDLRPQPLVRLPIPVISIGNITVGGTGKTPLTQWLCQRLNEFGHKPAILTPLPMKADEPQQHLGYVLTFPHSITYVYGGRDRVASARKAVSDGATVIVLDDGFQYRRLHRDIDIVLWDATTWLHHDNPLLRQPLSALQIADALVLSKADILNEPQRQGICKLLNKWGGGEKVIASFGYEIDGLENLTFWQNTSDICLNKKNVVVATSVANQHYFVHTVQKTGCKVVALICFPDHYCFKSSDVNLVANWIKKTNAEAVVTTPKDAVKWEKVWQNELPMLILHPKISWFWGQDELWQMIVAKLKQFSV